MEVNRDPGSFRDRSGYIFHGEGRVFRTINGPALESYTTVRDSGVLASLEEKGWLIPATELDPSVLGGAEGDARLVLEHPKLPFVSYPYEWSFPALKAAALLQLDILLVALAHDVALSDATAYNVQFIGARPVFIDTLSFRPYRDGEFWRGHRQFCEQFLNPLLLRAYLAIAHNAWYRGNLDGIPTRDVARLMPLRRKLSWNVISQVLLQAKLDQKLLSGDCDPEGALRDVDRHKTKKLARTSFRAILIQLRGWIAGLEPADTGKTAWQDYVRTRTYSGEEEQAKRRCVAEFAAATKPGRLCDLGCNTGEFAEVALEAGAATVIGFDMDHRAVEAAFARADERALSFLPLYLDAANPSPDQGWNERERQGLSRRVGADAVVALAFEHHLAIGRNVPLDQVVDWLTNLAPRGLIEFVQPDDPTLRLMLAQREDIYRDYDEAAFAAALERRARIVRKDTLSAAGRRLYWFDRA